ncbi:hypothetical protein [Clostridium rectalis]|uniref:hypothetical protein n=1 Tax=Clostridium rectalis TaxID=2040295 RepID=UPI000F636D40|nr:hypothetical protein [Clostridium rectalis]
MYIKIIDNIKVVEGNITNYIYDNLDTNLGSFILNKDETLCVCNYNGVLSELNQNTVEITKEEYDELIKQFNSERQTVQEEPKNTDPILQETVLTLMTKIAQLEKQVGGK